jgi:hypothetical protein
MFECKRYRLFGVSSIDDFIGLLKAIAKKTSHVIIVIDNKNPQHGYYLFLMPRLSEY